MNSFMPGTKDPCDRRSKNFRREVHRLMEPFRVGDIMGDRRMKSLTLDFSDSISRNSMEVS